MTRYLGTCADFAKTMCRLSGSRMGKTERVTVRRLIGYWGNDEHPEYPDPTAFVDSTWDRQERHEDWSYASSGTMAAAYMGLSPCRICGEHDGAWSSDREGGA